MVNISELMDRFQELKRRRKIVFVPEDTIRDMIDLPEGSAILGIDFDWNRRSFAVHIGNMDFPTVPDAAEGPSVYAEIVPIECEGKKLPTNEPFIHRHLKIDWEK